MKTDTEEFIASTVMPRFHFRDNWHQVCRRCGANVSIFHGAHGFKNNKDIGTAEWWVACDNVKCANSEGHGMDSGPVIPSWIEVKPVSYLQ